MRMKMNGLYIVFFLAGVAVFGLPLVFFAKMKLRFAREAPALPKIADVPAEQWNKLAEMKILFGHQSVGFNIIDGVKDIIGGSDVIKLNIAETSSASDFNAAIFAHARVGKNTQPISKIEQFSEIMNSGVGEKVDVAFFKFCYVDVTADSNPREVFDRYKAAIGDLQQRYPKVRFVHFTAPLKSLPRGVNKIIKSFGRWLLGMPTVISDNLKREQYNRLIREEYGRTGRLFDLAFIESVGPDGLSCYVSRDGQRIPFMAPQYTDDGGHLNNLGRRVVAEQMLLILSQCAM